MRPTELLAQEINKAISAYVNNIGPNDYELSGDCDSIEVTDTIEVGNFSVDIVLTVYFSGNKVVETTEFWGYLSTNSYTEYKVSGYDIEDVDIYDNVEEEFVYNVDLDKILEAA